jgi:hypothetical protein
MTGGRIQPTSVSSHAIRYLRAIDRWTSSRDLGQHLGIPAARISCNLAAALARGEVQKRGRRGGVIEWRFVVREVPRFGIDWPPRFESKFFEARA